MGSGHLLNTKDVIFMENSKPVYFLKMNPLGWKRSSLAQLKAAAKELLSEGVSQRADLLDLPWFQRHEYLNTLALVGQEKCWEHATGVKPEEAFFTLIVPIHNEENSLLSFLHTLMLSDIPAQVNMQVVFVTNACVDSSVDIVRAFMAGLGEVECQDVLDDFGDQNIDRRCAVVRRGHHLFMHINTAKAGKANALNIGNRIASQSGHVMAMSMDANNFIEPDAVRNLFAHAYKAFREKLEAGDIVLYGALEIRHDGSLKPSSSKNLLGAVSKARSHLVEGDEGVVNGWMLAWNTVWMNSVGGCPEVALEDYALGVLARASDFRIVMVEDVIGWGYAPDDLKGLTMTRARYVRGRLQICDYVQYDPSILAIIEKEAFYMRNFPSRLMHLLTKSVASPLHAGKYMATFLLWEYAIQRAVRDYKRNPKNQSWDKVPSTY
jgi:cellulose synthase/poly-beta-1,6-N-acetylglucosamine synthase-like glycosyltransferase